MLGMAQKWALEPRTHQNQTKHKRIQFLCAILFGLKVHKTSRVLYGSSLLSTRVPYFLTVCGCTQNPEAIEVCEENKEEKTTTKKGNELEYFVFYHPYCSPGWVVDAQQCSIGLDQIVRWD